LLTEGSGSVRYLVLMDPDPGGPKTFGAGQQQEQGGSKSSVTARARRQQEQGDSKSRATARSRQQKEQGDSKSKATERAG
jgi:hypothetical protein